jgi:hypothetical protein
MNRRFVAICTLVSTLAAVLPARAAHAQEIRVPAASPWLSPTYVPERPPLARIMLTHSEALGLTERAVSAPLISPTSEIRLSRGAKTAIIVTAIVVGVLLIVGAVVLTRPGKHLP